MFWKENDAAVPRLLVHRRSRSMRYGSGLVSVPGGLVEAGGTFRDSASRELQEEAGLFVQPSDLVKVTSHNNFGTCRICDLKQREVYKYVFTGPDPPSVRGPDAANAHEIDQEWGEKSTVGDSAGRGTGFQWVTEKNLRKMHHDPSEDTLWFPGNREDSEMFLAFGRDTAPLSTAPVPEPLPEQVIQNSEFYPMMKLCESSLVIPLLGVLSALFFFFFLSILSLLTSSSLFFFFCRSFYRPVLRLKGISWSYRN